MKKEKKIGFSIIIAVSLILLVLALSNYISAILSGLILAYLFFPVYEFLKRKLKREYLSAGITLAVSIIIIILPLIFLSGVFVNQSVDFFSYIHENPIAEIIKKNTGDSWISEKAEALLEQKSIDNSIRNFIESSLSFMVQSIPSIVGSISGIIIKLFIAFAIMFFALIDEWRFIGFLESFLPFKEKNLKKLEKEGKKVIKTIIYGMVIVSIIQGAIGGIGFLIFGLERAVLWGAVMAVASLIPFIGAFLVWVPASIYLFFSGDIFGGIGLFLYGMIIVGYSDNIARMKIFSSIGNVHPVITLLGILIGLPYFGIMGLIIGPLIIALFTLLLKIFREEYVD